VCNLLSCYAYLVQTEWYMNLQNIYKPVIIIIAKKEQYCSILCIQIFNKHIMYTLFFKKVLQILVAFITF